MENNNEEGTREISQQPQAYSPPRGYYSPPKKSKSLLIGIIAVVVIAIVILAAILMVLYFSQSPLIGKWHITEEKITYKNGTTENQNVDTYIIFNSSGTGYTYTPYGFGSSISNFTWENKGNNQVELSVKRGSISMSFEMGYSVQGDKITLEYSDPEGIKYTMYGEKVNSVPHQEYHSIDHWTIMIGGKNTKEITCTDIHQDGTAWYDASNGDLEITVYDENNNPLANVKVTIEGCGIVEVNHTNSQGYTELSLSGVHLGSGQQVDEIKVTLQYGGQIKSDSIAVIRGT